MSRRDFNLVCLFFIYRVAIPQHAEGIYHIAIAIYRIPVREYITFPQEKYHWELREIPFRNSHYAVFLFVFLTTVSCIHSITSHKKPWNSGRREIEICSAITPNSGGITKKPV